MRKSAKKVTIAVEEGPPFPIPLVVSTHSVPTRKVEYLTIFTENKPYHQIRINL